MAFLEAQKLVKEYNRRGKTFRAVDDIDFTIEPGDFVMIEGESGSGKTTFLNLLTGLTDPTSGAVIIDGRSLKETGDKEISKIRNQKIKYIPQGESLLSALTVRENILFPFTIGGLERPSEERLLEVSDKLGITDLLDEYPSDLSGGEMRRATIARAVINKPSLIIADEPTGSLDSANTFKVMEIFRDIASEGTAVIVVTHQKETLGYATRVLEMDQGSLKEVV
ncbi:MAG: ABC transporter ATP-binding protein [Saccharofermentans sp.]|jgi:putative ABC transport system ATP-binding protein|nr:ABC transporter ATP-binding protein [Clostridiales bacterium]MCR4767021.1 ABC transporter ATP-binding protein [Saccharofermentans sp.]